MRHPGGRTGRGGWTLIELIVAIGLLGMIAALAADVVFSYRRSRNEVLNRQMLVWAASAQLDRIAAGASVGLPPPEGVLPEGVSFEVQTGDGEGRWKGLTRVTVTAKTVVSTGRELREQVSRFIVMEGRP
ncbi:MAG: type II secretion system protein [Pseudomonadales bacterium]|nr:type II secretion system protein [Pseudomonadales bacterium]